MKIYPLNIQGFIRAFCLICIVSAELYSFEIYYGNDAHLAAEVVPPGLFQLEKLKGQISRLSETDHVPKIRFFVFASDPRGLEYFLKPTYMSPLTVEAWKQIVNLKKPIYPVATYIEVCGVSILRVALDNERILTDSWTQVSSCTLSPHLKSYELLNLYFPLQSEEIQPNTFISLFMKKSLVSIESAQTVYNEIARIFPRWSICIWVSDQDQFLGAPGYPLYWPFSGRSDIVLSQFKESDVLACINWTREPRIIRENQSDVTCQIVVPETR